MVRLTKRSRRKAMVFKFEATTELEKVGQRYGLKTPLNIEFVTGRFVARCGPYYRLSPAGFRPGGNTQEDLIIFFAANAGKHMKVVGRGRSTRIDINESLKSRKWLAMIIA